MNALSSPRRLPARTVGIAPAHDGKDSIDEVMSGTFLAVRCVEASSMPTDYSPDLSISSSSSSSEPSLAAVVSTPTFPDLRSRRALMMAVTASR